MNRQYVTGESSPRMSRLARHGLIGAALLLAGCAANPPADPNSGTGVGAAAPPPAAAGTKAISAADCRAEVERLRAQLAAEVAERQRLVRAASRREDALRKQLEAMKSIERGILDREDRIRPDTRTETR